MCTAQIFWSICFRSILSTKKRLQLNSANLIISVAILRFYYRLWQLMYYNGPPIFNIPFTVTPVENERLYDTTFNQHSASKTVYCWK
jgi:hypothetical protein